MLVLSLGMMCCEGRLMGSGQFDADVVIAAAIRTRLLAEVLSSGTLVTAAGGCSEG